jgi:heterodisulfide reductase subunit A-like polyferredoxin
MAELNYMVAVVGAGPAGLYASRKLAEGGARVVLFNRDVKPGGLAEYGIYWDKYKMKQGLRNQFKQIIAIPQIEYFGNVTVCCGGNIVLEDLQQVHKGPSGCACRVKIFPVFTMQKILFFIITNCLLSVEESIWLVNG